MHQGRLELQEISHCMCGMQKITVNMASATTLLQIQHCHDGLVLDVAHLLPP